MIRMEPAVAGRTVVAQDCAIRGPRTSVHPGPRSDLFGFSYNQRPYSPDKKVRGLRRSPRQLSRRGNASGVRQSSAEFRALLEGCAIFDMSWQAKLVLSGEDRVRWLNGMVTNNVRDLAPGRGVYSFLLSAQGRIQGDLLAYNRADYLLVTTERNKRPPSQRSSIATSSWTTSRSPPSATSWRRWMAGPKATEVCPG